MTSLSVVIPVYRSAEILPDLLGSLESVLPKITPEYEVILVDDCSPDGSWEVIRLQARERPWIRGIRLMRNYGQHNALLCGIRAARQEVIVTMDDDLQHPPEEIPKLLAKLDGGFDAVYGPPLRERHGLWRDVASRISKLFLQNAMGAETARSISAFRAFRTPVRKGFDAYQGPNVNLDVLLTWGAARFATVPVEHRPRKAGTSNYTFRLLLRHTLNMVTGFSTLPLRITSVIGFVFALVGFAVLCYVLGRYFIRGGSIPGFPFLASIISIFSGVQLFALGVIGEYLARIHFRMLDRPAYVVEQTIGAGGD